MSEQRKDACKLLTERNASVQGVPCLPPDVIKLHMPHKPEQAAILSVHLSCYINVITAAQPYIWQKSHYLLQPASSIKQSVCSVAGVWSDWIPKIQPAA